MISDQLGAEMDTSTVNYIENMKSIKESMENGNMTFLTNVKNNSESRGNYKRLNYEENSSKNEKVLPRPAIISSTTMPIKNYVPEEEAVTYDYDTIETDTGWPDFGEAILKNINKHKVEFEENRILERNWFGNRLLEPSWMRDVETDKTRSQKSFNAVPESNIISPIVSFKPMKNRKESNALKDPHLIRSRLYEDPKILEFPLKEPSNNSDLSEMNNRTSRPMFLYHRVTTSPQERKNSAFIAVSVVKKVPLEPPVTNSTPETQLENTYNHSQYSHGRKVNFILLLGTTTFK